MKKNLRLGFIGGGINSAVGNTHRIAAQMDNRWELIRGYFSRDEKINYETCQHYGIDPKLHYENWKDFLLCEKEHLDAVSILTPTPAHAEMVVYALELGYAVICEKAVAMNCTEVKKIQEAVQKNKGFFTVTYNYTGYPMLRELKKMIENQMLGDICHLSVEMPQEGFLRKSWTNEKITPQDWRLVDGEIPTISLDLGVHLHNLVYFLIGEQPTAVVAEEGNYGNFKNIVDNVYCIARYPKGVRCQFWYSKSALGNRNGLMIRLFGTKGSAEWIQMNPEFITYYDQFGHVQIIDRASKVFLAGDERYNRFKSGHPAGFIEAFANYYCDIADCLVEFYKTGKYNSPYLFNEKHAYEGLKMFEAIAASARKKQWVSITKNS